MKNLIIFIVFVLFLSAQGIDSEQDISETIMLSQNSNAIPCKTHQKVCAMEIVVPVCGKNGATNQVQTFMNPCLACSNPQMESYQFGRCQASLADEEELEFDVQKKQMKCMTHPKACFMEIVAPVCGLNAVTNSEKTYMNPCMACSDAQVDLYTMGKCQQDQNGLIFDLVTKDYTCETHPKFCAMEIVVQVCGTSTTGTQQTYLNPCLACSNQDVSSYKFGKCVEEQQQQPISLPKQELDCQSHPKICLMEIVMPVCGKTSQNTLQTYDNPCMACQNNSILSYTIGKC